MMKKIVMILMCIISMLNTFGCGTNNNLTPTVPTNGIVVPTTKETAPHPTTIPPTEEPTEIPTEVTTDEPTTQPTEPSVDVPTEPSVDVPTEPTKPTEPVTEAPTEALTEPTTAPTEPTEPVTEAPTEAPTDPPTEPTTAPTVPTEQKPTDPPVAETKPVEPQPTVPQPTYVPSQMELEALKYINKYRVEAGLNELVYNADIYECAKIRAQEAMNHWSHTRPNGSPSWSVYEECGKKDLISVCSENLARNFNDIPTIMEALYNSEGHRKNILYKDFTSVGIVILEMDNGYYCMAQLFVG